MELTDDPVPLMFQVRCAKPCGIKIQKVKYNIECNEYPGCGFQALLKMAGQVSEN
jgi:hypothetical protein